MSSQNNFQGKFQEGTFASGQGPILGVHIKVEEENKGLINPATPGKNLKAVGGQGDGLQERAEEKGFDIYGSSYRGPQNLSPKDMGETPNFAINKK